MTNLERVFLADFDTIGYYFAYHEIGAKEFMLLTEELQHEYFYKFPNLFSGKL